jgi:phage-related protein
MPRNAAATHGRRRKLIVRFYASATGRQVVKDELAALGTEARAAVLESLVRLRGGESFAREVETVAGELRALRVTHDGDQYRLLYAHEGSHDHVILCLRALAKKQQKLPKRDIRNAQARLRDWRDRGRGNRK